MKSPEEYLLFAKQSEKTTGKLKVFFGMSPGVGKTYAMLEEAHRLREEGKNIFIALVETHGRSETEKLLQGLKVIPLKKINYKDKIWNELDVEAIISQKPEYVLVDELAHTNIPGSIHRKRYQDVLDILEAGINVLTTVNVQHLESQVDLVEKNLHSTVQETIPDSILEKADELVLIDIIPDELLKRLQSGNVYLPEKIEQAKENFFKKENLTYLRELSLSYTTKFVEKRLPHGKEKILVAISSSPHSKALLRHAKRIAIERNAEIFAVFTESEEPLQSNTKEMIRSHIHLAEELGMEVIHSYENDPLFGIIQTARERNVDLVLVGQTGKKSWYLKFKKPLSVRLLKNLPEIEISIVPLKKDSGQKLLIRNLIISSSGFQNYVYSLSLTFIVTVFNLILFPYISYWHISIFYLFYVAILGLFFSRGPVLFASILSGLLWNYLFIPPRFTFFIDKMEDLLMFFVFIFIALVNGNLTTKLKKNETKLRNRGKQLTILYELTASLSKASSRTEIISIGSSFFKKSFPFPVSIHLFSDNSWEPNIEDPKDLAVAIWVVKNGKPAGKFTETLPSANNTMYPLRSSGITTGILCVTTSEEITLEQEILLNTLSNQVSIALERSSLSEEAKKSFLLKESEKLYSLLFNSLSHELKTPLTSIQGSASALLDPEIENNENARKSLIEKIQESSLILNLLVGNLLDVSRLESGHLTLKKEWIYTQDLIHDILSYLGSNKDSHEIQIELDPTLEKIYVDKTLFGHALFNIIYNACIYTPVQTRIWIQLKKHDSKPKIIWTIEDNGKGLPENPAVVFQKFFRGDATGKIGTGLGLAITKSIVELHGGSILAENNPNGGAKFNITLPIQTIQRNGIP